MIVVTSDSIPGRRVVKTLGLVKGNTIRARHVGKDILAGLKGIVGGEISEYTKMVAESREQSLDRLPVLALLDSLGLALRGDPRPDEHAGVDLVPRGEQEGLTLSLSHGELVGVEPL